MSDFYILDTEHNPVPVDDVLDWARWFENIENRIVRRTLLDDGKLVSTVFLGIGDGELFETMVFEDDGTGKSLFELRGATWQEALEMHEQAIQWALDYESPKPRGFAKMSPEARRAIASKGGKQSHALGKAHKFTSQEASDAGKIGGASLSKDREHMREIARLGQIARKANREKQNG